MEKEEGEMSDDNAMLVDDADPPSRNLGDDDMKSTITYKTDKNGVIVTQLEKIDAFKLEERAKRFGLNLTGSRVVTQRQIDELYLNCGIESGNERHFRFDALHLSGVDGLTTREIFEYLEDFKPVSLEKIDEISCNIVCQDHISTALALLVHSREIKNEDIKEMLAEKSNHHWREGMPHPKKDLILMRFATNGDKKMTKTKHDFEHTDDFYDQSTDATSKNPWGDLCKSWGVYDHQEVFQRKPVINDSDDDEVEEKPRHAVQIRNKHLAMRLGKRTYKVEESEDSGSDSEWKRKSKTPRMRMHADDEETKQRKKVVNNVRESSSERDILYAPLSIEVDNSRSTKSNYSPRQATKLSDKFKTHDTPNVPKSNIQSRLGLKIPVTEKEGSCDEDSSEDSNDHYVMSRVEKVNTKANNTSNVWSRLENTDNDIDSGVKGDLRHILKSKRQNNKSDDLRDRLSKSKQSNLRIEIDNNYARY